MVNEIRAVKRLHIIAEILFCTGVGTRYAFQYYPDPVELTHVERFPRDPGHFSLADAFSYVNLRSRVCSQRFVHRGLFTEVCLQRFVYRGLFTEVCLQRFVCIIITILI